VLREDPSVSELPHLAPVVDTAGLAQLQQVAAAVKFEDSLVGYLLQIVRETSAHESVSIGVSPRGAIALRRAAQARALVEGRDYCIPEDVRDLAVDVLAHRIQLDARSGRAQGREEAAWIVREILEQVPVPL